MQAVNNIGGMNIPIVNASERNTQLQNAVDTVKSALDDILNQDEKSQAFQNAVQTLKNIATEWKKLSDQDTLLSELGPIEAAMREFSYAVAESQYMTKVCARMILAQINKNFTAVAQTPEQSTSETRTLVPTETSASVQRFSQATINAISNAIPIMNSLIEDLNTFLNKPLNAGHVRTINDIGNFVGGVVGQQAKNSLFNAVGVTKLDQIRNNIKNDVPKLINILSGLSSSDPNLATLKEKFIVFNQAYQDRISRQSNIMVWNAKPGVDDDITPLKNALEPLYAEAQRIISENTIVDPNVLH